MTDEQAKARRERYRLRHPERVVESRRRYCQSEKGRIRKRLYATTPAQRAYKAAYKASESSDVKNARQAVTDAVRLGRLTREPCAVCGSVVNVQGHHRNGYALAQRLDVDWLCALHHRAAHAALQAPDPLEGRTDEREAIRQLKRVERINPPYPGLVMNDPDAGL